MSSAGKLIKACAPCHDRKVRCDAAVTALPCRRCIARGCTSSCVRASRRPRGRRTDRRPVEKWPVSVATDLHGPEQVLAKTADSLTIQVQEGQAQVQICREMAGGNGLPSSAKMLDSFSPGRDLVEYHSRMHYMTILGELVGHDNTKRLTRIVIHDAKVFTGEEAQQYQSVNIEKTPLAGLGPCELEFLSKKGALSLPPKSCCDKLLQIYFEFSYPYAPVFDRVEFLQSYESGQYSRFLMEAILANATQCAPVEVLRACGYKDRLSAQKILFSNAALLYDLGYERSQLRMLQGSLLLGTTVHSYTMDKDFRYWLHNATRIATRMGLHKKDIAQDLDSATYKMCRRIWWSLYIRDISMSLTGLRNMRMLDSSDCDTCPLTEDDWEDEDIPPAYLSFLSPITQKHRLFMVESVMLAVIGERCLAILKNKLQPLVYGREGEASIEDNLAAQFASWRASLPTVLLIKPQPQASDDNVLPIMLMSTAYRYECILYRTMIKRYQQAKDEQRFVRAKQRLRSVMLEMDILIGRVMIEDIFSKTPLKFVGSVFTILALHIESALGPTQSHINKAMAHTYIRQNILFLRQVQQNDQSTVEWTLRLFEWVLDQKGLSAVVDLPKGNSPVTTTIPHMYSSSNGEADEQLTGVGCGEQMSSFVNVSPPIVDFPNDPGALFEDLLGFEFLDDLGLLAEL